MHCPSCRTDSRSATVDSRPHEGLTYRKRRCPECGHEFTTVETPTPNTGVWADIFRDLKKGRRVQRKVEPKVVVSSHLQSFLSPDRDIPKT